MSAESRPNNSQTDLADLARCKRRCNDLAAQLRQSKAEQERILETLQGRLLKLAEESRLTLASRVAAEQVECARKIEAIQEEMARLATGQESVVDQMRAKMAELEAAHELAEADWHARLAFATGDRTQLNQALQERDQSLARLQESWEARKVENTQQLLELASAKEALDESQRRLAVREEELRGIYRSLSWRLTAPLRWLNRPFYPRRQDG